MSENGPSPESGLSPEFDRTTKPEIFLEIGPGLEPSVMRPERYKKMFQRPDIRLKPQGYTDNKIYLGMDTLRDSSTVKDAGGLDYGAVINRALPNIQNTFKRLLPDENIFFVAAEGQHIPLQDETVTEVYMANSLTAPQTDDERADMMAEVNRVLKPGGELVVKCDWDTHEWPIETVAGIISSGGLQVDRVTSHMSGPDFDLLGYRMLEERYGHSSRSLESPGFFIEASKPDPTVLPPEYAD